MKIGIIGAGNIAEEHLKVISSIKSISVSSIYSRTKKKSDILAKKYKIKNVHPTLDNFIDNCSCDGIYILVSASQIYNITKKLIPINIPLFIEKPAGLIPSQTLELLKLSNKYKTLNMVGYNRRFYSIYEDCIKLIKNPKEISNIVVEGHERIWKIPKKTNNSVKQNWIYANSTHTIDLLRFFGGDIKKVTNMSKKNNNYLSIINFKNGIIGEYFSNWNTPSGWSVKIYSKNFYINFSPLEKGYYIDKQFNKKFFKEKKYDKKYKPGFYMQTISFISLIKNKINKWPSVNLDDVYKTMKLAEKIKNNY